MTTPLADRMRPQEAAHFYGQQHLLTAGSPLARVVAGQSPLHSMLFWGPPGCGKTTLARLLARRSDAHWFSLSAVTAGIREVRAVISEAERLRDEDETHGQNTPRQQDTTRQRVLFVDEVHHFNKTQQDAFLPHVESGLFILMGATTENPSFELNNALLSRLTVYHLQPLPPEALAEILTRALDATGKSADADAHAALLLLADGDARRLLNILEQTPAVALTADIVRQAAGERGRQFDKGGDNFYDQISALHKSVRGSDPDAALYWFCRMLDGGADPLYLGRRLVRIASEDVGLADPRALGWAMDADAAYRRLGSPEGELALAQIVVYLACVPKSDAVYRAFNKTRAYIAKDGTRPVPLHLRNAPTRLLREEGAGRGYRHAHDEPGGFAAGVHYFPDAMQALRYYRPTDRGLEKKIGERLRQLTAFSNSCQETKRCSMRHSPKQLRKP